MPIIQPDTSLAQDMGAIEPGTYPGKILEVEYKTSSKGSPMIVPKVEVNVGGKMRTRTAYVVVTGAGAYGFDQLLRACGFEDIADQYRDPSQANPPFDTDQLIGQEVQVRIDNELYNGNMRDSIKSWAKA